jgi:hypothetical protein
MAAAPGRRTGPYSQRSRGARWGAIFVRHQATHVTRRQGRPYTLVLVKTEALFARERQARIGDEADLDWLTAQWDPGA